MQKDLADKIRAEYGDHYFETEGGGLAGADGAVFAPPPGRRAVSVAVACMSRAGREPGYKKTNQVRCLCRLAARCVVGALPFCKT